MFFENKRETSLSIFMIILACIMAYYVLTPRITKYREIYQERKQTNNSQEIDIEKIDTYVENKTGE